MTVADRGYCFGVEDGLDGYCVHTATCKDAGKAWSGPNSTCVRFDSNKHRTRWTCTCGHPGMGCYCR